LTINTIYFWPQPIHALTEIRRVLRRDGTLVTSAGFRDVEIDRYRDTAMAPDGMGTIDRESFLVTGIA